MRKRLTIGETARLVGMTPKAIRHYHKLGLLTEPERSEAGYRLYTAEDLLRLARIRRLRSLGLPLRRIGEALGGPDGEHALREVLEALLVEVSREIERMEERRSRIEGLLAGGELEEIEKPRSLELAEEHLGEHLAEVSPELLEQDRKLWAALDAFDWPESYRQSVEAVIRYYADHPNEYRVLVSLAEPLVALDRLPADAPEVEHLADEFARRVEQGSLLPTELVSGTATMPAPLETVCKDIMMNTLSPAQRRFWELVSERLEGPGSEWAPGWTPQR